MAHALTAKASFLILTGLLIFSASLILQKWFLSMLSLPFLLPVLVAASHKPVEASQLRVSREVSPSNTFAGDVIRVKISVANLSGRDALLEIRDNIRGDLKVLDRFPHLLVALEPRGSFQFAYSLTSHARGHFSIGPLEVWCLDPFLVTRRKVLELPAEGVAFLPSVSRIAYLRLPYARTTRIAGEIPSNSPGEGFEFMEISETDVLAGKRINWRAVAKARRPFVNTYRAEKSAECLVVLDVPSRRLLGRELTSILVDKMVELAATLVYYLSERGNRVSLLVVGNYRDWVKPGFGKRHLLRILHSLADVKSLEYKPLVDYSEVFQLTAPFLTKSGSLIFVISTFTEPSGNRVLEEAVYRGYNVVPVAVNPFKSVEGVCSVEERRVIVRLSELWDKGVIGVLGSREGLKVDFQLLKLVEAMLCA
ncbi:MAG: DUF58 domain-containing protein [Thermofilum sp.]|nr:DUF58 domain-containing protein [Thermofilum sp.]